MSNEKQNPFSIVGTEVQAGSSRASSSGERNVQAEIAALVEQHTVLLFMKGTPEQPQCGFSDRAVTILETYNVPVHAVNVLADNGIREGIKLFSDWPTIPQVYIKGEFVGGSDTLTEMHQTGQLAALLKA